MHVKKMLKKFILWVWLFWKDVNRKKNSWKFQKRHVNGWNASKTYFFDFFDFLIRGRYFENGGHNMGYEKHIKIT